MISNFSFLERNASQYLSYMSLPEGLAQKQLKADIPLPVLLTQNQNDKTDIVFNWDDVLHAILYIFLWQPQHRDISYYQRLAQLIQPEISHHLLFMQRQNRNEMRWEQAEQLLFILNTLHNSALWIKMELGFLYETALAQSQYRKDSQQSQYWGNALNLLYTEVEQRRDLDPKACYQLFFYYLSQQKYHQLYTLLQQHQKLLARDEEENTEEDDFSGLKAEECEKLLQQLHCFAADESAYKALLEHFNKQHQSAKQLLLLEQKDNPFIAYLLALQHLELREYKRAYTLLNNLLAQFDFLGVTRLLAICCEALGDCQEAESLWKKLLKKETENLEAMQHLAQLAAKNNNIDEAQAYWRTIVCFDPDFPRSSEEMLQGSQEL